MILDFTSKKKVIQCQSCVTARSKSGTRLLRRNLAMMKKVLLTLLCVAGTSFAAEMIPSTSNRIDQHDWLIKHKVIVRLVELTNEHRARSGLPPVVLDTQMCLDAQRHATWMCDFGRFQHSGMPYMEIIHQSVGQPEYAIQGWIASPPHNGIMLSGATKVGFGYNNRNGYPYWVGVFR